MTSLPDPLPDLHLLASGLAELADHTRHEQIRLERGLLGTRWESSAAHSFRRRAELSLHELATTSAAIDEAAHAVVAHLAAVRHEAGLRAAARLAAAVLP